MPTNRGMGTIVVVASSVVSLIVFLSNLGEDLKTAVGFGVLSGGFIYLFGMLGRWMFWRHEGDEWEEDEE